MLRTSWGSACAGSDQMTAPPDQATAGWSRSQRPWIRSVPTQDSDRGCSEWAVQQTGCAGGIAHIQACAAWARHGCFGSRGCSGLAMPCHALSCLAARGGRLHCPDDAQAERREADVRRRAAALVGLRAAGLPRPQSSRRHWRTAASARRCRSRAARGGRHPPRYCFLCGIGPRPPGRSNRLALTVRVIGLRGTRSCPAGIRTSPFALGPADLAVVLWRQSRHAARGVGVAPVVRERSRAAGAPTFGSLPLGTKRGHLTEPLLIR